MTRSNLALTLPAVLCSAALLAVSAFGPDISALAGATPADMTIMANALAAQRFRMLLLGALTLGAAALAAVVPTLRQARRERIQGAALTLALARLNGQQPAVSDNAILEKATPALNDIFVRIDAARNDKADLLARAAALDAALALERQRRREGALCAETSRCHSLKTAAGTLGAVIGDIHEAASDLSAAADNATRGAGEQRRLTTETATAMEQMNDSVAQVAQGAEAAATAAARAMEQALAGAGAVEETVAAIHTVHQRTTELGAVVAGLGSQAEGIGEIMTVIADIADQTNLLALNAAIEAARAGDAGRGFAVVADEVRKLAEKTMNATRDVGGQIESIQQGVSRTRAGMQNAAELVEAATGVARRSGEMLSEIVVLAGDNSGQIQSIAAAATQQSAASEQITRAVSRVEDISRRTVEDMQRSGEAQARLLGQVHELDGLNGAFELMGSGKVQKVLMALGCSPDILSMDPPRQEQALRRAVQTEPSLELLYMTDVRGIQPVPNVPRPGRESAGDARAKGRDWSGRPWFIGAMEMRGLYISEVYVSQASGERCITVSMPFAGPDEATLGVIAADVTLRKGSQP